MKYYRTGGFLIPSILLTLLIILSKSGLFEFPAGTETHGVLMDKLFYYLINCTLWITVGYLINLSISEFIWGGLVRFGSSSFAGQKVQNFTSMLVYTIVIAIILFGVLDIPSSAFIVLLLTVVLVLGTFLRPKIISLTGAKYLSSEHPFNIGDWIELINTSGKSVVTGEVYDVGRKGTRIKTENNSIVLIPNNLLEEKLIIKNFWGINKQTEFEINLCLDFSLPVERAKRILNAGARQTLDDFSLTNKSRPKILINSLTASGIEYSIRFYINPAQEFKPSEVKDKMITTLVSHLNKAGVYTAYPKNEVFISQTSAGNLNLKTAVDRLKILSNIELFNSFTETELKEISEGIKPLDFKENSKIIEQGQDGNSMFILIEGLLEVFIASADGGQVKVGKIIPGGFFGEMSLLTGEKRSATIKALTEARVFEITKNNIASILQNRVETIEEISRVITERQHTNIEKLEESGHKKIHRLDVLVHKIKVFFSLVK